MKKADWKTIVSKDHSSVFADTGMQQMFLGLLGRGYFPRQLPPPFTSESFVNAVQKSHKKFNDTLADNFSKKTAQICHYSLARPGQLRRVLGLPNPSFHFLISLKLASVFDSMSQDYHFASHDYSMSFPIFQTEERNRAFEFATDWDEMPARRLKERAKGRYLVSADIARFFPSIYTHSIPWAVHGKEKAKKNRFDYDLDGNFLDLLIRNSQDGQTLGVPIGPDTSFIISETILLKIDEYVHEKIKNRKINCFHRVDDYEFVCMERQEAEFCIAILQEALQIFELELNTLKTEIHELPQHIQDPEVSQLRSFDLGYKPRRTKLFEYYDLAFECYKRHPKGTLKYAIKRIPTDDYYDETIADFMAQSMLLEPGVIEAVFTWLTQAECADQIDKEGFVSCLSQIIQEHSVLGHSSEVAWAIWGFLLLQEKIPAEAANAIVRMNDSVVLLLALDATKKGFLKHANLMKHIKTFMGEEQLYGPHWLLAYEAVKQGWVATSQRSHVDKDPFFSLLKTEQVSFYQSQEINKYKEIMKDWQPYNPYVSEEPEDEEFDEIDVDADF